MWWERKIKETEGGGCPPAQTRGHSWRNRLSPLNTPRPSSNAAFPAETRLPAVSHLDPPTRKPSSWQRCLARLWSNYLNSWRVESARCGAQLGFLREPAFLMVSDSRGRMTETAIRGGRAFSPAAGRLKMGDFARAASLTWGRPSARLLAASGCCPQRRHSRLPSVTPEGRFLLTLSSLFFHSVSSVSYLLQKQHFSSYLLTLPHVYFTPHWSVS